jgi:hypothetical protein
MRLAAVLVGYFKVGENTPKNRGRNFRFLSCNTSIPEMMAILFLHHHRKFILHWKNDFGKKWPFQDFRNIRISLQTAWAKNIVLSGNRQAEGDVRPPDKKIPFGYH